MADTTITTSLQTTNIPVLTGTAVVGAYKITQGSQSLGTNLDYFIKSRNMGLYGSGMRPNTKLFVFFDGVRVSDFVTPATLKSGATIAANSASLGYVNNGFDKGTVQTLDFAPVGAIGASLYTDSLGDFAAILRIPKNTFTVGEKDIIITDVDNLNSIGSATTHATCKFNAFNLTSLFTPQAITAPTLPTYGTRIDTLGPLAQSFYVGSDGLNTSAGIFVTSVSLYFKSKDPIQGITVDIRQMDNGVPSNKIMTGSRVIVTPNNINISPDSSVATVVTFAAPVFLPTNSYYALTVAANGNNPNYVLYTAQVGQPDLLTATPIVKNWGQGDLFTSTNGNTWVPVSNEFMKFTLNRANFTSTANSSVSLVNKDYEFFYASNTYGAFEPGEFAFQLSSNLSFSNSSASSSNVSISQNTYTITLPGLTGSITSGFTQFSNTSVLVASNGGANAVYDVVFVANVVNSTAMTIKNVPIFSGNVVLQWTPVGRVYNFDVNTSDLTLEDSTATNSSFCFTQNSTVVGISSRSNTQIGIIRDRVINRFVPFFYNTNFPNATATLNVRNTDNLYNNTSVATYGSASINHIVDSEIIVASKSSEIVNMAGRKSFVVNVAMTSNSSYVSPSIYLPTASFIAYKNQVTSSYYAENTKHGSAINKYISKTITLASGLDSEDLAVYIDAYKPQGTIVNVYGKFLSAADPDPFDTKEWTLLLQDQNNINVFSDPVNLNDIKEYKYSVPTSPFSTVKTGVITTNTGNATITGINTSFTTDIMIGDLVKIYSDSTKATFQVSKVTAIANNTSITIDNNSSFITSAGSYERVDYPRTAFLNTNNGNIIRYYSSSGIPYDTYISYAIKIVLASQYTYRVPRVLNLRSIAVT
jgi:hypothetical protein